MNTFPAPLNLTTLLFLVQIATTGSIAVRYRHHADDSSHLTCCWNPNHIKGRDHGKEYSYIQFVTASSVIPDFIFQTTVIPMSLSTQQPCRILTLGLRRNKESEFHNRIATKTDSGNSIRGKNCNLCLIQNFFISPVAVNTSISSSCFVSSLKKALMVNLAISAREFSENIFQKERTTLRHCSVEFGLLRNCW